MTSSKARGGSAGATLTVEDDGGGRRHVLEGRPVHAGTPLEILMEDGSWLPGRYENQRLPDGYVRPMFHVTMRCKTAQREWANDPDAEIAYPEAAFIVPGDAILRWPER